MMAEATFVVLVTPSSVPGQWVAHCLNLDLVTQGDSVHHAFAMALEAVRDVVRDDLAHGLDPMHRNQAPEECWKIAEQTTRHAVPLDTIEDPAQIGAVVGYLRVALVREALAQHSQEPVEMNPPVWQMATLRDLRSSQRNQASD